jgi:hypothetical protein
MLERVRRCHLQEFYEIHSRHGQYHWVYTLFVDPTRSVDDLIRGIGWHIQDHRGWRLGLLLGANRPMIDGTEMTLAYNQLIEELDHAWRELGRHRRRRSAQARLDLRAFRRMLGRPKVPKITETVVAPILTREAVGENRVGRLYLAWHHLVQELCLPNEAIANAVRRMDRITQGSLFFDIQFRQATLTRLKPLVLGVGIIFGLKALFDQRI